MWLRPSPIGRGFQRVATANEWAFVATWARVSTTMTSSRPRMRLEVQAVLLSVMRTE